MRAAIARKSCRSTMSNSDPHSFLSHHTRGARDLILAMRSHPRSASRCKKARPFATRYLRMIFSENRNCTFRDHAKKKGGGAPEGAYPLPGPAGPGARHAKRMLPLVRASGALALRRSTAVLAGWLAPTGSAPGHASWEAGRAGVTRPRLSQSRDCTSRTGRSTGVNDARSRPGAVCETARGNRTCSTF